MKKLLLALLFTLSVFSAPAGAQATPYHYLSAASNNSTLVGTGMRTMFYVNAINTTDTLYYVRFYDLAAAPTCSSASGVVHNIPIPASITGAGVAINLGTAGALFQIGLGFCITAGAADNNNTSAATGVFLNLGYR